MTLPGSARYESRRDAAFGVLVWSSAVVSAAATVLAGVLGDLGAVLPVAAVAVFDALFMAWLWFGTCYAFEEDVLVCRSGPFRERVRLDAIVSVRATRNMLSSMSLSRDRLEIRYGPRPWQITLVSPVDRRGFLEDLRLRCPAARIEPGAADGVPGDAR